MLQKWKIILVNWINCYFTEGNRKEFPVTLESLLNIISHLRQNFSLDESKSSILDVHTIQEFILEKYPTFRFENGTVEPIHEEEIYVAASLLLFFVCVNSKDVDIKSAMCNKLSAADQETILQFSKCLMECSEISSSDVLRAIADACGQDVAADMRHTVAETPPALRSLHSEVRRLQAALDAERFDRNYLQDELARTNLKMEKLVKDREQYKQDIVNLKAKISMCCGQESETQVESSNNNSIKLQKQLEQTEQRLVIVQEQLDEVQYDRDMYKNKLDELKRERDKWYTLSQQEAERATQLSEELDTEKRQNSSLRDLVIELRQHNRNNGFDTSQLECDDLDASVHSLPLNASVCSEACANVIEVQLSEERAKIVLLKQQIQMLQDQLNDLNRKSEEETQNLSYIISEKDTEIFNLKHRINEEIEIKNTMKSRYDDDLTRLNNEVNELEQRLRDNGENSRRIIDSKMQEIQILQDEKLSLLQSFSDEVTKLENVIKNLKTDLDAERSCKHKIREDFDKQIMKFNEKVLNRNNELVELQNKIFEKGETIEQLQTDLRKEKESRGELANKYNTDVVLLNSQIQELQNDLRYKTDKISDLDEQIQQCVQYNEELKQNVEHLSSSLSQSEEDCKILKGSNEKLQIEVKNRDVKIQKIEKTNECQINNLNMMISKLTDYLKEKTTESDTLRNENDRLQHIIEDNKTAIKTIENELQAQKQNHEKLISDFESERGVLKNMVTVTESVMEDQKISLNKEICEYIKTNEVLEQEVKSLKKAFDLERNDTEQKLKGNKLKFETAVKELSELRKEKDIKEKTMITENERLVKQIAELKENVLNKKSEIDSLIAENKDLCEQQLKYKNEIHVLEEKNNEWKINNNAIEVEFGDKLNKLQTELHEKCECVQNLQTCLENKTRENTELQSTLSDLKDEMIKLHNVKADLEAAVKDNLRIIDGLKIQVQKDDEIVHKLMNENSQLHLTIEDLKTLEDELRTQKQNQVKLITDFESERVVLKNMVTVTESVMEDQKISLNQVITEHIKTNEILKQVVNNLKQALDSEKNDTEQKIKDKDVAFEAAVKELSELRKEKDIVEEKMIIENERLAKQITELEENVSTKKSDIENLLTENKDLCKQLQKNKNDIDVLEEKNNEWKIKNDAIKVEFGDKLNKLQAELDEKCECAQNLQTLLENKTKENTELQSALSGLKGEMTKLHNDKANLEAMLEDNMKFIDDLKIQIQKDDEMVNQLMSEISQLQSTIEAFKTSEDELRIQKQNQEKLIEDSESERVMLKNMVTATESAMEDQKISLNKVISDHLKTNEILEQEIKSLKEALDLERNDTEQKLKNRDVAFETAVKELDELRKEKDIVEKNMITENETLVKQIAELEENVLIKKTEIDNLIADNKDLCEQLLKNNNDIDILEEKNNEWKIKNDMVEVEFSDKLNKLQAELEEKNNEWKIKNDAIEIEFCDKLNKLQSELDEKCNCAQNLQTCLDNKTKENTELQSTLSNLKEEMTKLHNDKANLEAAVKDNLIKIDDLEIKVQKDDEIVHQLMNENSQLRSTIEALKTLEDELQAQKQNQEKLISDLESERVVLKNIISETESVKEGQKITLNKVISEHIKTNEVLEQEVQSLKQTLDLERKDTEQKLKDKDVTFEAVISELSELRKEKDIIQKNMVMENEKLVKQIAELEENVLIQKTQIDETNSVLKDQNISLSTEISEHIKTKEILEQEVKCLKEVIDLERNANEQKIKDKDIAFEAAIKELSELHKEKNIVEKKLIMDNETFVKQIAELKENVIIQKSQMDNLIAENKDLCERLLKNKSDIDILEEKNNEWKIKNDSVEVEFGGKLNKLQAELDEKCKCAQNLQTCLENKTKENTELQSALSDLKEEITNLHNDKADLEAAVKDNLRQIDDLKIQVQKDDETVHRLMNENSQLKLTIEASKTLESDLQTQIQNQEKMITKFESERVVLKNIVSETESVNEDQKITLNKVISEHIKTNEILEQEVKSLKQTLDLERKDTEQKLKDKDVIFEAAISELSELRKEKDIIEKNMVTENEGLVKQIAELEENVLTQKTQMDNLIAENKDLCEQLLKNKNDINTLEEKNNEWKIKNDALEIEFGDKLKAVNKLQSDLNEKCESVQNLETCLENKTQENTELQSALSDLKEEMTKVHNDKADLEAAVKDNMRCIDDLKIQVQKDNEIIHQLMNENSQLQSTIEENSKLESRLKSDLAHQKEDNDSEKINLSNKCTILQEYQLKAEQELERRQKEINVLQEEIKTVKNNLERDLSECERTIVLIKQERDDIIEKLKVEVENKLECIETLKQQLVSKDYEVNELKQRIHDINQQHDVINILRKENEVLVKAIGQRETFAAHSQEKSSSKHSGQTDKDQRELQHQVDNTSDLTQSSVESFKTISDLEKIVQDKNRTITTLQSDITYLKSLIAESENKLLDVTKDLEMSKENCHQLSSQLKKIVHQKNEEIGDLKKQVIKMSATENRASQIIKVSAKYQAIILKRIAEIKSNTVLKELTNFGNSNSDNEIRRSLTAGTITMEDLENFLETTERHIRRCSEKQIALQKDRDRLAEVNRISESEIINMRKFLTELSVSIKTFNSVKELYTQKLSRVVSLQRTVRREILSLEGHITDAAMCKLERGYAAAMQDLSECAMNLERWVERCISRAISSEKIKQAFTSESERVSLASGSFQNAGLDVQLEELQANFQKLLEEVVRAQKGEGAKDAQSVTVMEVRAEYEDKLKRMKVKMNQLYQEQIAIFKEKQKEEIAGLEAELQKAHYKLRDSSKAYEKHIRGLTTELFNVGEKFLMKNDEAEWLRKRQQSGSLMSLQHVHSSGLVPMQEEPSRPSDTHSLRSLPVTNNTKNLKEGRGLHMSDEEGEVFDNRCLRELQTPRRERPDRPERDPLRLSELRWRNSLCPPHLKSSYPAETQFAPLHEDDIKCAGSMSLGGRGQRKEVGITAYKKPGPPTPSKQAGRLSATDSELRESLRVEGDPSASRKTGTPSRLRALFRPNKNDTTEGTPRSRRLSNIFRRK